jgi:hypothetical protein
MGIWKSYLKLRHYYQDSSVNHIPTPMPDDYWPEWNMKQFTQSLRKQTP